MFCSDAKHSSRLGAVKSRCRGAHRESELHDARALAIPSRAHHNDVRRNNLEVVLRHLAAVGPDTRAGIAARAGLTRATVSRLVAELIELGLVRESGRDPSGRAGRPGTRLELDGHHVLAIGAEVNVDYLSVLAIDLAGREVRRERRAFDATRLGAEASIVALADLCRAMLRRLSRRRRQRRSVVAGLTVAVPGLVDIVAGVVAEAPNLRWRDVAVADALRRRLRLDRTPLAVGNDANLAAIGEYRMGEWAGTPNLVYITGEVGIGGGIIVGGQPLLGTRGYAGEVGHMNVEPAGPLCGCGRHGCWEACIGLNALLQSVSRRPRGDAPPEAKLEPVINRARAADPRTLAALDNLGDKIGIGAANLANLFDPQVIILGGYFVELGEWILPPARRALQAGTLARPTDTVRLTTSTLGFAAAALGGAIHAMDRVVSNPTTLLAA
jgi:predicted NBD/HSP70 family sugar kinase